MLSIFRCVSVGIVLWVEDVEVKEIRIFYLLMGGWVIVFFVEMVEIEDILDFVVVCLSVLIEGCVVVRCRECSVSILNSF